MINFVKLSNSNGSFKILISCNNKDAKRYLKELSDDIFAVIQQCSIYYIDDKDQTIEDIKDYKVQLNDFNLFVFPITKDFLTLPSRARDIDYEYAIEKSFKILPILVEDDLYGLFNNYKLSSGNANTIQVLDKTTNDPTQDPYKVKLEKYIKSIFIDKETEKKIKKAFDAYIFLSYRKKDRKYAQEIMSLIHKNDFMRDIAIWYDEFLTNGEDFNEEISTYLLKSKLMALVVTPNVNEKDNYVIKTEYPKAIEANKPVLPIEAVETNKEELQNNFKDIQNPINKDNYDEITKFFKDFIIKNGLDKNDDDPEHLYFIGLAYLNGICTDRDLEKAIDILTKSAELEFLPAIRKIIEIYDNADNKLRTKKRKKKWIMFEQQVCNKKYGPLNKNTLNADFKYGKCLLDLGQIEEGKEVLNKCLENRTKTLGANHQDTISTMVHASTYNDSIIDEQLFNKTCMTLLDNKTNADLDDIAKVARVCTKNKIIDKAKSLYEICYKKSVHKYGLNHDRTIGFKRALFYRYLSLNDKEGAYRCYSNLYDKVYADNLDKIVHVDYMNYISLCIETKHLNKLTKIIKNRFNKMSEKSYYEAYCDLFEQARNFLLKFIVYEAETTTLVKYYFEKWKEIYSTCYEYTRLLNIENKILDAMIDEDDSIENIDELFVKNKKQIQAEIKNIDYTIDTRTIIADLETVCDEYKKTNKKSLELVKEMEEIISDSKSTMDLWNKQISQDLYAK